MSLLRTVISKMGLALAIAIFAAPVVTAQAFIETFNYPVGQLSGNGTPAWAHTSTGGSATKVNVVAGNLSYSGLSGTSGNHVQLPNGTEDPGRDFSIALADGESIFYSAIIKVNTPVSTVSIGDYFMDLSSSGSSSSDYRARLFTRPGVGTNTFNLGLSFRNVTGGSPINAQFSTTDYANGTTLFVVVSYDKIAGAGNDTVRLWVNPAIGLTSPPAATLTDPFNTDAGTTELAAPGRMNIRQGGSGFDIEIDEIRVDKSWAAVTSTPISVVGDDPNLSALSSVNFGNVATDSTADSVLVITNNGTSQNLNVSAASITGANAAKFSVVSGIPASSIAPAGTANVTVRYNPSGLSGLTTATLVLTSNDQSSSSIRIALFGVGIAALPLYEGFEYNAGAITSVGNSNWANFASAGQSTPQVLDTAGDVGKSLNYTSVSTPLGRRLRLSGGNNREDNRRLFSTPVSSGPLYATMLLKVTSVPTSPTTANDKFFAFTKQRTTNALVDNGHLRISQGTDPAKFRLGVSLTSFSSVDFSGDLNANQTYFLALKYDISQTSASNQLKLWINANPSSSTEGSGALATVTHSWASGELIVSPGEFMTGIQTYQDQFAGSYTLELDEIRVGQTWNSVSNSGPPPNKAKNWNIFE